MASKLLQDDGEMFMDRIQNDRDIKRPKRKQVGFWPEETDFIITWLHNWRINRLLTTSWTLKNFGSDAL